MEPINNEEHQAQEAEQEKLDLIEATFMERFFPNDEKKAELGFSGTALVPYPKRCGCPTIRIYVRDNAAVQSLNEQIMAQDNHSHDFPHFEGAYIQGVPMGNIDFLED